MNINKIIYSVHLLGYDIFVQYYQAKADSYVPRLWIAMSAIRFMAGLHAGRFKIRSGRIYLVLYVETMFNKSWKISERKDTL